MTGSASGRTARTAPVRAWLRGGAGDASPESGKAQPELPALPPCGEPPSPLRLIAALCQALARERVTYCHWKSNDVLERSASGDNDLDLLIRNEDADRFIAVLSQLGFKRAETPPDQSMPGVLDYFGYDPESGRIVHVHAHFRMVIGDDRFKNYRLPIERAYLAETSERHGFRIPRSEMEFVVFVIRMMIKHCSWDAVLAGKSRLKRGVRGELDDLRARIDNSKVNSILKRDFPFLDADQFWKCVQALEPGSSLWKRVRNARRVQRSLHAHTRRSYFATVAIKIWQGLSRKLRRRTRWGMARRRLASGGAIIAIVGGDGAGKSTAVDAVAAWLGSVFATRKCHIGKPPRSCATRCVAPLLKIARTGKRLRPRSQARDATTRFPGYTAVLRELCRARDRYRHYVRARRFANRGGIVVCDRFPMPEIESMDTARMEEMMRGHRVGWLMRRFLRFERSCYGAIRPPEILLVLKLDPEIAVQRRRDEDADFVRARSGEIWQLDESQLDARFIDASRSKEEVLAEIRQAIWGAL